MNELLIDMKNKYPTSNKSFFTKNFEEEYKLYFAP
jgi:hypothetical protein